MKSSKFFQAIRPGTWWGLLAYIVVVILAVVLFHAIMSFADVTFTHLLRRDLGIGVVVAILYFGLLSLAKKANEWWP